MQPATLKVPELTIGEPDMTLGEATLRETTPGEPELLVRA